MCSADAEPMDCRGGRCRCWRVPRHLSTFPSALHSPTQVLPALNNKNKSKMFMFIEMQSLTKSKSVTLNNLNGVMTVISLTLVNLCSNT